ncbi:MAG: hypothetical protein MN733_07195, partial [Nitrososphaera sp.]|nr:hypothetical protein [Nitrososphaera sp.]
MDWTQTIRTGFSLENLAEKMPVTEAVSLPEVLGMITKGVSEHLRNSSMVSDYINGLPKGPGTSCPDSPIDQLVKYVSEQTGQIDKSDPALNLRFIRELIMPTFEFERKQLLLGITLFGPRFKDISAVEYQLFRSSCELARAIDVLWTKWFETVAIPYQSFDQDGKDRYIDRVKSTLAQWDYTAFVYDPDKGCVDRKPWALAFPQEIASISRALK